MAVFVVGQRWVSDTESELGLGTVADVDFRVVTLQFRAVDEQRRYAINNAPLSRVKFKPGDGIECRDGMVFLVSEVEEQQGVLTYYGFQEEGSAIEISEIALSDTIQFNKPQDRLFAGLIDSDRAYQLRYATQQLRAKKQASAVYGLSGVRTALLPHQMYIAHEVAQRYAPRVLLADEVGLGKTIEAGLILHQQLLTGKIGRVLIVVPESLSFQWLVEMLRRFNLQFSLFDEERCEASEEDELSPFLSEQLVLCSLEFLAKSTLRQEQVLAGEWGMLIVDEAHHLQWEENKPSPEYAIIEKLAAQTQAILLLTATPDQLGHASHFARLRLLDPDRFFDLQLFLKEEQEYGIIAGAVASIMEKQTLNEQARSSLHTLLGKDYEAIFGVTDEKKLVQLNAASQTQAIRALLDRHGTGRILFRNSRRTVGGFPKRILNTYPLPLPELYRSLLSVYARQLEAEMSYDQALLPIICPERLLNDGGKKNWLTMDPRVAWLLDFVMASPGEKILLICSSAQTVLDLEQAVRDHGRIRVAVFHEGLSIVQRDRAAAYFAETEQGAQILMCSELGSEGRNFQFSHHLVLFDLPLIPDLLEQRIGRLDRIGQRSEIQLHVPYFQAPVYEALFLWYHEGLEAFTHTSAARYEVDVQLGERLRKLLIMFAVGGKHDDVSLVETLIKEATALHHKLVGLMAEGRDRLLELNSHNLERSTQLLAQAEKYGDQAELQDYVELLFDCAGIEMEDHSHLAYIVKPGSHMSISGVPYLTDDGVTVTFDRDLALSREDILYLSWEHPMIVSLMEWISGSETGNTSVVVIDGKGEDVGQSTLFLEVNYVVECPAPKACQVGQYLSQNVLRVIIDEKLNDYSDTLDHVSVNSKVVDHGIDPMAVQQVVKEQMTQIEKMIKISHKIANKRLDGMTTVAGKTMIATLSEEIQRLSVLKSVNPNIRDEELVYLQDRVRSLHTYISGAKVRVDALRLIFVSG